MTDDELWTWWLSLDDEWRFFLLRQGLELKLWKNNKRVFDEKYDYQAEFDWLDKSLVFECVKEIVSLTKLNLERNQIQDISALVGLTNLTELYLWGNQIRDILALKSLISLTELDLSYNQI